ncbi:penicillin-insensitive murein endopeptidase [Microbulbifer sp. OS29]|uniref:Penicillin-insensitive murein endopeptidase n=1 Tax=Microbulbifer okhotskensis TaxID=2926617 RepID=A0A9X2EL02_9GAMM|nr:penicillin-insensitive murein endopeptidase [Microbulbifer okhotskensis]MCO1333579.1 penicillin-insensitive murein endopeptidase [Microbulbifer okhotskensis]
MHPKTKNLAPLGTPLASLKRGACQLLSKSLIFTAIALSTAASANPWEEAQAPSDQAPASIGTYTNGCLGGGETLPLRGEGFQLVRTGRERHFAHPQTINFLKDFSQNIAQKDLGRIQIGDMSMARGGPFGSGGHSSHQTGLDVDIWYSQDRRAAERALTQWERDNISAIALADERKHRLIPENWDDRVPKILRLAAEDQRVERIFVHPTIKRHLCKISGTDNEWLRKVRPWWGHNYHFHVRLACPKGSSNCKPQAPVSTTPCGNDLDWWFSDDFYAILNGTAPKPEKKKPKPKTLPQQCEQVLSAPSASTTTE